MVKNLPTNEETQVRSLGWKDPLEEGMATNCNILSWRIPKNCEAWRATVPGVTKSRMQLKCLDMHTQHNIQMTAKMEMLSLLFVRDKSCNNKRITD